MQSQLSLYPNKIAAPGGAPAEFPRLELPADFSPRRLLLILGDQLTPQYLEHTGFDPTRDAVVMFEVAEESTHVPSHKARTTLFLAAMRHFALGLRESGTPILYVTLDDPENSGSFAGELKRLAQGLRARGASDPEGLAVIRPGEWRVLQALESVAGELGWPLELHEDPHFLTDPERFAKWAEGRKQLVLEYFYRDVRKRQKILLDENGKP
ncbi:MAG: cryptochrome/photolyase family protein, partial [Acidobacteriota bacterium]